VPEPKPRNPSDVRFKGDPIDAAEFELVFEKFNTEDRVEARAKAWRS
jgi:hypothetical protein